ncbi:MAG: hypothetical protein WD208_08185 [Dehalococcoidia bacterium]
MWKRRAGITLAALVLIAALGTGAALGIGQSADRGGTQGDQVESASQDETQDEVTAPFTPIDRMEMVAKEVPAFGGLFKDRNPDGSLTVYVYMTDESDRAGAEKAADALLRDSDVISEMKVLKANYPFTDIAEWYRQLKRHLWAAVDEITASGMSYETNQIRIYVSEYSARAKVRQVLRELGIPVDAVLLRNGQWSF